MRAVWLALPLSGCVTFSEPEVVATPPLPHCLHRFFPLERVDLTLPIYQSGLCVRLRIRELPK